MSPSSKITYTFQIFFSITRHTTLNITSLPDILLLCIDYLATSPDFATGCISLYVVVEIL
jgi:hypothetical protein